MSPAGQYYATTGWDIDAWVEIIAVEYESLVAAYPFDGVLRSLGGHIDLLDAGCGTGIFPGYIDPVLSEQVHITADLLDMSEASLRRAAEVLGALEHFSVGESHRALIEDLPDFDAPRYDVIWAIHSLTTVDRDQMPRVFDHMMRALRPGGYLFVYQLTAASAYQRIHGWYRERRGGRRYMEFEDSARLLSAAGYDHEVCELAFDHVVPDEEEPLTKYLQKVTLDDTVPVGLFEPMLGEFREGDTLRFPQTVNLIAARRPG